MKLRIILYITIAFATAVAFADEPWKDKSYKQWDDKDLRLILTDSPWARPISGEPIDKPKRLTLDTPSAAPTEVGKTEEGDEDDKDDEKEAPAHKPSAANSKIIFLIRWVSSRTLREASVRGQILHGKIPDADADKYLLQAPEDYQIVVVGQDMTSFQQADEATLVRSSQLRAKISKKRAAPSKVEIVRAADGRKINAIVFHFPKKLPSGRDIIMPGEQEAKFECHTDKVRLKVVFQVQKMVDQQGLDL